MEIKKILSRNMVLFTMGLCLSLLGCSGEDGTDGVNGEQGPPGADGADGKDGNANVIVSDWMQITWDELNQLVPPTLGAMYIDEITGVNDITAFMETGGIVLFYLKRDLGVGYISVLLPYQEGTDRIYANVAISTDPNYTLAGLVIHGESIDVTKYENNNDYMIRYLLVPANVAQASDLINKMPENFDEATTLLGLEQ